MKLVNFRYIAAISAVVVLGVATTACSDDEPAVLTEAIYPSEVEMVLPTEAAQLIYTDATGTEVLPMLKGESFQLSALLHPDNVTFQDVIWSSSSTDNVTVDDNGKITAVSGAGIGYSVITVAPDPYHPNAGINATLKVVVSDQLVPATNIEITSTADEVYAGESVQMTATILPDNATYHTVKWSSSDTSVATVDIYGVVTGVENSQVTAEATITATALDGSGVTASRKITVNKVVAPSSITIDQKYAMGNYDCAINEHQLQLEFTTVPASATRSMLTWESSDEEIATVENGLVTFNRSGNFGDVTITATCPETGYTDKIVLNLPAGLHRELFRSEENTIWWPANGQEYADWHYGHLTVNMDAGSKLRRDIKSYETVYLHAGNYPFFAIKMEDLKDRDGCTARNITLDASGKCDGADYRGGLSGNNNKWVHDYKCSDGSHVFVYDLSTQAWATGGVLPTGAVASFTTFQLKYADVAGLPGPDSYEVYWVQSFKSLDDIVNYITNVDGVTYEQVK
jgi:uncharacterized protein YjdB